MEERSILVSKLRSSFKTRLAYIQAKVGTLVPSQIRALRLKSEMPRQADLAVASEMHQSRISMFETPGANPTIGTLSAIAAGLKVGLKIEFVPFSEMLEWENDFSQDSFDVVKIDKDLLFLNPAQTVLVQPAESVIDAGGFSIGIEIAGQFLGTKCPTTAAILPAVGFQTVEVNRSPDNWYIPAQPVIPDTQLHN